VPHAFLLAFHIFAGAIALMAGGGALAFAKGHSAHAKAGICFVGAMLSLTSSGLILAALKPDHLAGVNSVLTAYLVLSAWVAARGPRRLQRSYLIVGALVAAACAIAHVSFGLLAAASPRGRLDHYPSAAYFIFAGLAAFAGGLDIIALARRKLKGNTRIARHLWRMCMALFFASSSFFLGQQKVMPEALRGSPVLLLAALLPLGFMAWWLFRVMVRKNRVALSRST